MDIQPITLEGRTVRLEPLASQHAGDLATHASPNLFLYSFPPSEYSADGFDQLIQHLCALPDWCPFAIVLQDSDKAIGTTAYLDIRTSHRGLEIGFTWITEVYQGTHVNPECKYLLLRHAFEDQAALRVQLKTDARNVHSQRAIEKLGAVREGVLRQHMIMWDGHVRDTVMYSIVCEEWSQVKDKLQARLGIDR